MSKSKNPKPKSNPKETPNEPGKPEPGSAPGPSGGKPEGKPVGADTIGAVSSGGGDSPGQIDSQKARPLVPTSPEAPTVPKRRIRRTQAQISADAQIQTDADARADAERRRVATEAAKATVGTLVNSLGILFAGQVDPDQMAKPMNILPPPLQEDEKTALTNAWTPVLAEGGDIPPIWAAVIVTLAVFVPRLWWKFAK